MDVVIGHFSDLHADLSCFDKATIVPDIWVCTGDLFPSLTYGNRNVEPPYQRQWFDNVKENLMGKLKGIPLIWVCGNHDFVDLAQLLRENGYTGQTYTIDEKNPFVDFLDVRFSGFPGIPFITGCWNYECSQEELATKVERCLDTHPNVLLTHAGPSGILQGRWPGIYALASKLFYRDDNKLLSCHLFGHIHEDVGTKRVGTNQTLFVNSSRCLNFIKVDTSNNRAELIE